LSHARSLAHKRPISAALLLGAVRTKIKTQPRHLAESLSLEAFRINVLISEVL
jgi:hypothetical protein